MYLHLFISKLFFVLFAVYVICRNRKQNKKGPPYCYMILRSGNVPRTTFTQQVVYV